MGKKTEKLSGMAGLSLCGLIRVYRYSLSYFFGRQCRFLPTCSCYADEAIRLYGPVKGAVLVLRRIGRCHPWGGSGFDPVPDAGDRDRKAEKICKSM